MIQSQNLSKPDMIGAMVSALCGIHCLAAPFIFLAKAGTSTVHIETPFWYQSIDYLFIVISFVTIYLATKTTTKNWVRIALWSTWSVLLVAIINESFEFLHLGEAAVYIPALIIAGLHFYNQKYCKCTAACCTQTEQS